MDYHTLFQISATGMAFEKKRLEVATLNLANMNTTAAPGAELYRPMRVVVQPQNVDFGRLFESVDGADGPAGDLAASQTLAGSVAVVPTDTPPRLVRDPGNPNADARGYVSYPAVDQATEMVTAMTALRAYEANVAAAGFARQMATHALELGASR